MRIDRKVGKGDEGQKKRGHVLKAVKLKHNRVFHSRV
jgi:hypothetical protein